MDWNMGSIWDIKKAPQLYCLHNSAISQYMATMFAQTQGGEREDKQTIVVRSMQYMCLYPSTFIFLNWWIMYTPLVEIGLMREDSSCILCLVHLFTHAWWTWEEHWHLHSVCYGNMSIISLQCFNKKHESRWNMLHKPSQCSCHKTSDDVLFSTCIINVQYSAILH